MKTNTLSKTKAVTDQPDHKKSGLIDTLTKISPVLLWLGMVMGITATNIIAASIYVESKTPQIPPPPIPPIPPPPIPPIPPPPIPPHKDEKKPAPEFSGHWFLVLIADTDEFRRRESEIISELELFNKKAPAEKIKTTFILLDAQGERTWDISKDRVPARREVFSNAKVYESIHQVYQVREKSISPGSPKVFSVILWGSDVNPDSLAGLNLGVAPTWPKLFVWYGHPDKSEKLEDHLGSGSFLDLKNELKSLSNSLGFQLEKLERE